MIKLLFIILLLLMILIGGERGVISIITLISNMVTLCLIVLFIKAGLDPLIATAIGSLVIISVTLLYQNSKNKKTTVAFFSVLIIMSVFFILAFVFGYQTKIGGFNEIEQPDLMMYYSADININMMHLGISMIVIGILGAIMDTAMAISTGMYEVYENNQHLQRNELFKSGINIGKDILGTTINTLFFAYLGESILLFNLFKSYGYQFLTMINSKSFLEDFICILFSGIACVLIIPLTSAIEASVLTKHKNQTS